MNLPSFPTDNLYKFMAFAGLVTVLFCGSFPISKIGPLEARNFELSAEDKILRLEMEELRREIEVVKQKKKPTPEDLAFLRKTSNELEIKHFRLTAKDEQLIALAGELLFFLNFFRIGMFVGTFLMILGFWLWYYRVQKPQDMLLQKQIKETT